MKQSIRREWFCLNGTEERVENKNWIYLSQESSTGEYDLKLIKSQAHV